MQSYYVDQWEPQRRPARGDLHAAGLRRRLAARRRRAHQEAMLDFGHVGSIGVHLSDASSGRVGLGSAGLRCAPPTSSAARMPAGSPSGSPAPPKSTSPPAPPRSTRTSPGSASCGPATSPSSRPPSSSRRSCAWRPSTRWARRGSPPTRARASAPPTARVHGTARPLRRRRLAVPDLGRGQPDDDDHRLRQAGGERHPRRRLITLARCRGGGAAARAESASAIASKEVPRSPIAR